MDKDPAAYVSKGVIHIAKSAAIALGSFLLAIGINFFLVPHKFLDGGFIGIALVLHYLLGLDVGWMTLLFSAPVYAYAWFRHRPYFYKSVYGLVVSSMCIDLIHFIADRVYLASAENPLICAVIGGILVGSGSGLMLRHKISTDGSDLLALFLSERFSINVGFIIFSIDFLIIVLGSAAMSDEPLLLSTIMILTVSIVTSICTYSPPSLPFRPTIVLIKWTRRKK